MSTHHHVFGIVSRTAIEPTITKAHPGSQSDGSMSRDLILRFMVNLSTITESPNFPNSLFSVFSPTSQCRCRFFRSTFAVSAEPTSRRKSLKGKPFYARCASRARPSIIKIPKSWQAVFQNGKDRSYYVDGRSNLDSDSGPFQPGLWKWVRAQKKPRQGKHWKKRRPLWRSPHSTRSIVSPT